MKTLREKAGFKVIAGIICILSLSMATLSIILIAALLMNHAYDTGVSVETTLLYKQIVRDASDIMNNYFDPYEPASPWSSYFYGGIYTGDNTNFTYEITEYGSDEVVLSTYDGTESLITQSFNYNFSVDYVEITTQTSDLFEDVPTLSTDVFLSAGGYYVSLDEYASFVASGSDVAAANAVQSVENYTSFTDTVYESGFVLEDNGCYYTYSSEDNAFYITDIVYEWVETCSTEEVTYTITCYLEKGLPTIDDYRMLSTIGSVMDTARYGVIWIFAVALPTGLLLLILLGFGVGRIPEMTEPVVPGIYRIPPDIAYIVCGIIGICFLAVISDCIDALTNMESVMYGILLLMIMVVGTMTLCVYCTLHLCVRCKTHSVVTDSLVYRFRKFIGEILKKVIGHMSILARVLVCFGMSCMIELWILTLGGCHVWVLLLWFMGNFILCGLVCYVTLCFNRLKEGAERIAGGDYNTPIDDNLMVLDLKESANILNHIQDGMNTAVESRMRSERLKTELITNVSHDLKTPLTSIVTYVDLLKQEPAGSTCAEEYLEVLDRQSQRLKKLIEDLVEASKAATGNLILHAEPLNFSMLLGQALGEYSQRLEAAGLILIVRLPETGVTVMADGQRLWRVFDNLLGNIVKYAMPGTRVYITVQGEDTIVTSFRNISQEQLTVTGEELTERFIRGDASRHTEGSGLGLSISKSLMESMGGTLEIAVDGDLFKATVSMPILAMNTEKSQDQ